MKTPQHYLAKKQGAIMVFALLVILVGAIVLAGWVQMLATRAAFAEFAMDGQKRRIALGNGHALARQYLLEQIPSGSVTNQSYSLTNGWGGFTFATGAGSLLTSDSSPSVVNPFSPLERWGFGTTISGTLSDGGTDHSWNFRVRTRSPIYGGFSLTLQNPSFIVSTPITTGEALVLGTSSFYSFTSSEYQSSSSQPTLHSSGSTLSAFPYVPLTSGTVTGFSAYAGYASIAPRTGGLNQLIDDPITTTDGIQITDAGTVRTVQLDMALLNFTTPLPTSNALLYYKLDAQAVAGLSTIRLVLVGTSVAANANLPPVHVIYETGALDLTTVTFQGSNVRRIYLSIVKTTSLTFSTTDEVSWKLGIYIQGANSLLSFSRPFTCTGGIRTNRDLRVINASMTLLEDTDPAGLETIADRIAWLEDNQVL